MSDDDCPALIDAKVPVVILTGFLGSGKTTLLQYILTQEHGLKIAVIVNEFEFGKSIEKGLTMKSSQKEEDDWLELNNGCLCCTAKTQTVLALEALIARQGSLDLILIETSGLADPAPVAQMFWQDAALQSSLRLAGIVTVVDAKLIAAHLAGPERREAQQQLLVADRVILNKEDLVATADARAAVEAAVAAVNPVAERVWTAFSRITDVGSILALNTTDDDAAAYTAAKGPAVAAAAEKAGAHSTSVMSLHVEVRGMAVPSKHDLDRLFSSLLYDEADDGDAVGEEASGPEGHLVSRQPGTLRFDIVRSKAAVWVGDAAAVCPVLGGDGAAAALQAQSIGDTFDVAPMADAVGGGLPYLTSRFIFFGRRLDPDTLRDTVRAAFTAVPGADAAAAEARESDWAGKRPRE